MPPIRFRWRHVILSTANTWLHGDERGFRDRHHRIHSSGDYRHRPPRGEHGALYQHVAYRAGDEVTLDEDLRPVVGRAIVAALRAMRYEPRCVAVAKVHAHFLVELADDYGLVKRVAGRAKYEASCAVTDRLPGRVWADGGTFKPVDDAGHLRNAEGYILFEQGSGAWTWSTHDGSEAGCFGRVRPAGW